MTAGRKAPPLRVVRGEGEHDAGQDGDRRPTIVVKAGETPRVVDESILALVQDGLRLMAGTATTEGAARVESGVIFQRAGRLARIARIGGQRHGVERAPAAPEIVEVESCYLAERLTSLARFEKYDGRARTTKKIDCPERIARTLLERREYPGLVDVDAIVETPIVTADGRVLQAPGYDARTGLLLDFAADDFERVPDRPSRAQAEEALAKLGELISGFAFSDPVDHAAALAMLLTAIVRPGLPAAPLFLVRAPAAGSGKTLLARVAGILRAGREPAITTLPDDDAEIAKRLLALFCAGDPIVIFDNVSGELGSDDLCAVTTAPVFQGRVLGQSEMRSVPARALLIATGNSVLPRGDLTRRVVPVDLDTRLERPAERTYPFNPIERAYEERRQLVPAALTILRAASARAWRGRVDESPFPSFEVWSRIVRWPLLWLGLPDPCRKVRDAEDLDPDRQQVRALLSAWRQHLGPDPMSLAKVIEHAFVLEDHSLRDALMDIGRRGGELNRRVVGKWLARHDRRIEQGHELRRAGERDGVALWKVIDHTGRG